MKNPMPGQKYLHFKKGSVYEIISVAEDTETLDLYVIYKQIPKNDDDEVDGKVWARNLKSFTEDVEYDGKVMPRFKKI